VAHSIGGLDPWTTAALEELGEVLRGLRTGHHLTQAALAERSGLSQSTISRLEHGLAPGLRLAWLARIFAGYNRGPGPSGAPRWVVPSRPYYELLLERFARGGRLDGRMREAELVRARSIDRLMRLQASRSEARLRRERRNGS